MIPSTLDLAQAARRDWDVIVVGAGPAGSLAARELARRGAAVLLVDKAEFPRHKVCGCCLNRPALALLETVGLGHVAAQTGAVPLRDVQIAVRRRRATLSLPGGVALSRETFDGELVRASIEAGADFLSHTQATAGDPAFTHRCVRLREGRKQAETHTRIVLDATGLRGNLRTQNTAVQPHSRIGAGTIVAVGPSFYRNGTIFMAYGEGGYVGLVRLEDGRLAIAAALAAEAVKSAGGLGAAAESILADASFPPIIGLRRFAWRGTLHLTRRPLHVSAHRLFAIGDAAGYVEPFTGEGIAWALASAVAVTPLVCRAVECWSDSLPVEWARVYRQRIGRRQRLCRAVTAMLRHPTISRSVVSLLSRIPRLASPVVRQLNAPPEWRASRA